MRIRDLERNPPAHDRARLQAAINAMSSASFAHVGRIPHEDSTAIADTPAGTFDVAHTIDRGVLEKAGAFRLYCSGPFDTAAATTLALELLANGVTIATTGAVAVAGPVSGKAWIFRATVQARGAGASGELIAAIDEASFDDQTLRVPAGAGVAVDLSGPVKFEIRATWGAADAGNTITQKLLIPEHL